MGINVSKAAAAAIKSLAVAAFAFARNRKAVIALVQKTGATDEARREFIVGHMAHSLNGKAVTPSTTMLAKAGEVLDMAGHASKSKLKKGQGRRNATQEKAYGAARKAWHLIVKEAGVAPADNRGGANNKGKTKTGTNEAAPKAPPVATPEAMPKASDRETAMAFLNQQAAMLLAYVNKGAKHVPMDFAMAVKAFHKALVDIKA
jgi:hypothetical protein